MANTYTQIDIHIVFAVQGRQNLIPKSHKEEYLNMSKKFQVEYDEKYLFEWVETNDGK